MIKRLRSIYYKNRYETVAAVLFISILFLYALIYRPCCAPPSDFPSHTIFTVNDGESLSQIANSLEDYNIVRSPFWFRTLAILFGGEKKIKAGDYFFDRPIHVFEAVRRFAGGDYGLEPIRVTLREGLNVFELADFFASRFDRFDSVLFLETAPEGRLFPDTYLFRPNISTEEIIFAMTSNFDKKISTIQTEIDASQKPFEEILIMASILEEEAKTKKDKQMVAGVLWNRIEIGMALQVDATFQYVNGKNTFQLTTEDLREDSPYNTYTRRGLPPTPIANPGLVSIEAALEPAESNFFYYLSDRQGVIHYAEDFEGHKANRQKYLGG